MDIETMRQMRQIENGIKQLKSERKHQIIDTVGGTIFSVLSLGYVMDNINQSHSKAAIGGIIGLYMLSTGLKNLCKCCTTSVDIVKLKIMYYKTSGYIYH